MKTYCNIFVFLLLFGITSCKNNSYSKLLKNEHALIRDFLKREAIITTKQWPNDTIWPDKLYYKVPGYDDLYFHFDVMGDSVYYDSQDGQIDTLHFAPVSNLDHIVIRYKKFSLTYPYDTVSYWTTLDSSTPFEFQYGSTTACDGWNIAVRLMKYSNSQCTLICPSKQGFPEDQGTVTPYGYILKMIIKH